MILLAGWFFILCAVLYNQFFVASGLRAINALMHRPYATELDAGAIRSMQLLFLLAGAAAIFLAWLIERSARLRRFFGNSWIEKLTLAWLVLIVPLTALELACRPFAPYLSKETSLFVRDDDLGWRMRPNAKELWGGVTVRTNGKGLRGPQLSYDKPPGVFRVLYLGDSVAFGYGIESYEDAFPYVVERNLESSTGLEVETVNSGVGGYSPWQEFVYLAGEGIRYEPDLIVVAFVLNDVTEKFHLVRFGGQGEGYQLTKSYYSWIDRILSRSGLAYRIRKITRDLKARRKFGENVQEGAAKQQMVDVEMLWKFPDFEYVQTAWRITLENLQRIVDFSNERKIPVLLVVFPYEVQLEDAEKLSAPQKELVGYANRHGIPCLDLLPVLREYRVEHGAPSPKLFLDHSHPTVLGHELAAGAIARTVFESGWLAD